MKRTLCIAAMLGLALSACAPAAPTIDPAEIQASAIAAASTMIAMTQAAIPTATPTLPPSPTPLPSPTFQPLPTLDFSVSPTVIAASGTDDPCNGDPPMAAKPVGPKTTVKIQNDTKYQVTLSIWLYKNKFGECGWKTLQLSSHGSETVTGLPQGCYYGAAIVSKPSKAYGDNMCMTNEGPWTMIVGDEVIRLSPQ